ncbi:MAG TPA: hypothetical protein VK054_01165, partial [Beutenbergiaceae bacterium]|nr:hypothetical protein [Beutenbergiaceae bacterium]
MSESETWRQALPRRGAWVMPPAVMLVVFGGFFTVLGWVFLYKQTGQIMDQLGLLGAQSYMDQHTTGLFASVYHMIAAVTGFAVHLVGWPYILGVIVVIAILAGWQ